MTMSDKGKVVLSSAPPPIPSIMFVTVMSVVFFAILPSWEAIDADANVDTFTKRVLPDLFSVEQIAYIRLFFAAVIWATTFHMSVISNGWEQSTNYLKGSKLVSTPNKIKGIKTLFPFTSWSWLLLGMNFTLSGYIALAPDQVSPWLLRTALFCWETSAPFSFLVASVIRYAIWPGVLKGHGDTTNLKSVRNILMHNMNVAMSLTEACLLGGLPVRWTHVSVAPLVGLFYILFTWGMATRWNDTKTYGPQFIYFFFDTTLPDNKSTIALVALLVVLMVFYGFFASCGFFLNLLSPLGVAGHVVLGLALCSLMMRFND